MTDRSYAPDPPHRPTVMGTHGVVASGHYLASQAGLDVLKRGGNAMDAALTASGVLSVVRPHMTGIGGDMFLLFYEASSRKVHAINAEGPAPRRASLESYRNRGFKTVPQKGVFAVETPGYVAGWEMARTRFATRGRPELLAPAVEFARDGFPIYENLNRAIRQGLKTLNEPARDVYAPGGDAVPVGHLLRNPALADCFEIIATDGPNGFYHGEIARRVSAFFAAEGGLLGEDDFAAVEAEELDPVCTTYRGYTVWETPPVSQGLALLEALNIVEGYDLASLGWNQPETIHLMVEAKKIAYADRLHYAGDPRSGVRIPLDRLLSKEYAEEARSRIDPMHATSVQPHLRALAQAGGDTTFVTAVDAGGNAVSLIQSLFNPFGSGVMAGDTGIMLNNRLFGFWLQPGHPNALEPGKRTMSTLNAFLLTRDGEYAMSGGTPGGDQQIQVNLQMLADLIDFGMEPQQATEATKWWHHPGTVEVEQEEPQALVLEPRVPVWVREELERRGHAVKLGPDWTAGSHKIIVRHPESGVYLAGASPARDGYAVGW